MIEIVPYDPSWPGEYQGIASRLAEGLGSLAIRIDHIGSTAVPGLDAKDRIDIQVTVAELHRDIILAMPACGLIHRPHVLRDHCPPGLPDVPEQWAKFFFHSGEEMRPANIHVRKQGTLNQRYPILLRDYLRYQPLASAAYSTIKRGLAQKFEATAAYADFKDPISDLIWLAAEEWAQRTSWAM